MFVITNGGRFAPQKQNFCTMPPLMVSRGAIYDKPFPDFINRINPENREQHNQTTPQPPLQKCRDPCPPVKIHVVAPSTGLTCNSWRKKNRRRRRNRRRKNKQKEAKIVVKMQSESSSEEEEIEFLPKPARQRTLSVESDDSFVVFFDDDHQEQGASSSSPEGSDSEEEVVPKPAARVTKVRFAAGPQLAEIHPMIKWSFAYQAARKGPWEEHARDRVRFGDRIRRSEPVLNDVLSPQHRAKIYATRFQ